MASSASKILRQRLDAIGISQTIFAALAQVHESDVSRYAKGVHVAPERAKRMDREVAGLEDLVGADPAVRVAVDTVANIRAAQKRLAEVRRSPATAPWKYRGAEVLPDAASQSRAREVLATQDKAE